MIDESGPWKYELSRVAASLTKRKSQRQWTERSNFLVERDVMTSAYAVRKLAEAFKLSDEARAWQLDVIRFALIGRVPDFLNYHRINDFYDLDHGVDAHLTISEFCNQIIHSFIWMMCENESRGFEGIIVASDRERRKCLYFVAADTMIEFFQMIAEDNVVEMTVQANSDGERRVTYASASHKFEGC